MKRPPLQRAEKVLLISSVFLIAPMLAASWFYGKQNELPPAPVAEKQVPPSPNAFDLIVLAANQITPAPRAKYIGNNCTSSGIDIESSCQPHNQPKPYTHSYNRVFPLAKKQAFLQANQQALKTWRQSLPLHYYSPGVASWSLDPARRSRFVLWPVVRTCARAAWQDGRVGAALEWLLLWHRDACRSTRTFHNGKNHAATVNRFDEIALERGQVQDELELLAPHLNAIQKRSVALQLQENRALLPSLLDSLQASKLQDLYSARLICEKNDLRLAYNFQYPERESLSSYHQIRFRWVNKKLVLMKLTAQWNDIIAQSRKQARDQSRHQPDSLSLRVEEGFYPIYARRPREDNAYVTRINAREAVLLSAMAAHAFLLENRRNPRDLKELVPHYLRRVEADPFNRSKSLVYSAKLKTYPFFQLGKPIFKPPLPRSATPIPTALPSAPPPSPPLEEGADPPPSDPPAAPQPLGYLSSNTQKTLSFLLYSVGPNGRDDGGMDFKAAALPFWKTNWPGYLTCDDILAPAHWFSVQEFEKHESDELNARRLPSPFGVPPV